MRKVMIILIVVIIFFNFYILYTAIGENKNILSGFNNNNTDNITKEKGSIVGEWEAYLPNVMKLSLTVTSSNECSMDFEYYVIERKNSGRFDCKFNGDSLSITITSEGPRGEYSDTTDFKYAVIDNNVLLLVSEETYIKPELTKFTKISGGTGMTGIWEGNIPLENEGKKSTQNFKIEFVDGVTCSNKSDNVDFCCTNIVDLNDKSIECYYSDKFIMGDGTIAYYKFNNNDFNMAFANFSFLRK